MVKMMISRRFALLSIVATGAIPALADDNFAHDLYFQSNVGSFKALGNIDDPMGGTLTLTFRGTLLVSRAKPGTQITVSGSIRKEKEVPKYGKTVYFGQGTIKIVGKFDAIQFFGKDVSGEFHGKGFFRFYGEFDKDLNTGSYWFTPGGKKSDWGTGGMGVPIPYNMNIRAPQVEVKKAPQVEVRKAPPKGKG